MAVRQPPYLLRVEVKNFRSLRHVDVELGALNVLVGANGAGKSNFLDVLQFLGDSVRDDIAGAVQARGGLDRIVFRGGEEVRRTVSIRVEAAVTRNSNRNATDNYELTFKPVKVLRRGTRNDIRAGLTRSEKFLFKRTAGPGRRITLEGSDLQVMDENAQEPERSLDLSEQTLALATLPRLGPAEGGDQVNALANLFASFRVFDINVESARQPSTVVAASTLANDASNLSAFLRYLDDAHPERLASLKKDARQFIPGLRDLDIKKAGGPTEASYVHLSETGLAGTTPLADASFGSIRALALLALLYDPSPPRITCIEEIDHGLHPYVLDRLVELIREASRKTQFLIATHSPSLVNRLTADELIVCERDADGSSQIPAIDSSVVRDMEEATEGELGLGELWFSGVLGGVPE